MIALDVPAKLNLFLDVLQRREDGYHEILTIFHSIDLCDRLQIRFTSDLNLMGPERFDCRIRLECDDPAVPAGENNLIHRAIRRLVEEHWTERNRNLDFQVHLQKRIPMGAGLAGGSSDAAAALRAVNEILALGLGAGQLQKLAASLGADIPFCLRGGTAIGRGIGDELDFLDEPPPLHFLLAIPPMRIETAWAYGNLKLRSLIDHPDPAPLLAAWQAGDWPAMAAGLYNVFENVVEPRYPQVATLRQEMISAGALGARMSGSGSAVFGFSPQPLVDSRLRSNLDGAGIEIRTARSLGRSVA